MNSQLNTFNFKELVNTNISINLQSKFVDKLKSKFDEEELQIYVLNLYGYLNFHPTDDFPISLEDIINFVGFANKGNAKRMLENNFEEGEDYKESLIPRDERSNVKGGENKEKIMLNIDCFKQLCMLVKTDKGKQIRKYYLKLEEIIHEILKEQFLQIENDEKEKTKQLELNLMIAKEKTKQIELKTRLKELELGQKEKFSKWSKMPVHIGINNFFNEEVIYGSDYFVPEYHLRNKLTRYCEDKGCNWKKEYYLLELEKRSIEIRTERKVYNGVRHHCKYLIGIDLRESD